MVGGDGIRRDVHYLCAMPRPRTIPPNDVAERERIERFELDAAVILQMKQELADEYRVPVEDVWFMGLREVDDLEWEDRPINAEDHGFVFLAEMPSGRPRVLPLVSDWRYRCMTMHEPYLSFDSYDALSLCRPWTVEHGFCTPGGYDPGESQPLSPKKWKNFLKTLDAIGVWNWEGHYVPTDAWILDGHMWSLEIHAGDRHVKCSGSNGYPDAQGNPTPFEDPVSNRLFRRLERSVKRLMQ